MKTIYRAIVFLLITFHYVNTYSQNTEFSFPKKINQYFDSIYGADNLLINGRIYTYPNFRAKGNPFFYGTDLKLCKVFINHREFSNLFVNYNIVEDKLILYSVINNNKVSIELNNHLIDSFYISNFVPVHNVSENICNSINFSNNMSFSKKIINSDTLGFCEIISTKKYQLLIKHQKRFSNKVTEEYPYGAFTEQVTKLYLYKDRDIIDVGSRKKFLNTFRNYKKEIKSFLKKNNIKYKHVNNNELIKLMDFCENLN